MKSLPEEVSDAIEALNLTITAAEQRLAGLGLSIATAIEIGNGQLLHFSRREHTWQLWISKPTAETEQPLTNCTIEVRQRALLFLPQLYERMCFSNESRISDINATVARTLAYLKTLP